MSESAPQNQEALASQTRNQIVYPEGYTVTKLQPVSREEVVNEQPYLAASPYVGQKASRSLGTAILPLSGTDIGPYGVTVSLGAKRPGVPGDIHSHWPNH